MNLNEVDQNKEIKRAGEIVSKMFGIANQGMHWEEDSKPTIRGLVKQLDNPFLTYLTSDIDTFLHYGQKYVELDKSDIFDDLTGLATYDDIIRDPEYYREKKNINSFYVKMYPKMYAIHSKQGFKGMDGGDFIPEEKLVFEYAKKVLDGSRMPLPYLRYELVDSKRIGEYTSFGQEGRHRAQVANLLGVHKMPVLIVTGLERPNGDLNRLDNFTKEIKEKF